MRLHTCLQPAALLRLRVCRKLSPVVIDLLLRLAMHYERDGFVKGKAMNPGAVHGCELHSIAAWMLYPLEISGKI